MALAERTYEDVVRLIERGIASDHTFSTDRHRLFGEHIGREKEFAGCGFSIGRRLFR